MTVSIKNVGNGMGWGKYVLSNRGADATVIKGNPHLGDEICKSIEQYKSGNAVNFVISFAEEDNVSQEKGREIVEEFMKSFMQGFSEDEYHLDIVEHTDTDYLHYHARVPKLNLLTNTQLKLYWHKTDLGYKKAVINEIAQRYDLVTGQEMKKAINNPLDKFNQIDKWREEHGQKKFLLSSPKERKLSEKQISEYIAQAITAGLVNSLDDVKAELDAMGFQIIKSAYDRAKDFHYLTIENDSGKLRIKGDIYGEEFYRHKQEDRAKNLSNNKSIGTREPSTHSSRADSKQVLQTERIKRHKFIDKQYGRARKRAIEANARELSTPNGEYGRKISIENRKPKPKTMEKNNARYHSPNPRHAKHADRDVDRVENKRDTIRPKPNKEPQIPRHNLLFGKRFKRILEIRKKWRKRKLKNDRIRNEIEQTIRDARADVQKGIEERYTELSRKFIKVDKQFQQNTKRANEYDRKAEQDISKIRENIHELANQHRGTASKQAREQSQELDGTLKRLRGEEQSINQQPQELNRTVRSIADQRQGLSGAVERVINRIGEKIKQVREAIKKIVPKKSPTPYRGPMM